MAASISPTLFDQFARGWRGYVLIALLALTAGLFGVASVPPMDIDESRFAQASRQMVETGDYVRIGDIWKAVEWVSGYRCPPQHVASRSGDIEKSVADVGRAKEILGFSPAVAFSEGLQRTWRWFQGQSEISST